MFRNESLSSEEIFIFTFWLVPFFRILSCISKYKAEQKILAYLKAWQWFCLAAKLTRWPEPLPVTNGSWLLALWIGHCTLLPERIIVVMVRNKNKEQKEQWAAWPLCKKASAFSKPTPDTQGQSHVLIQISYPHGSSGNWKRWESYRETRWHSEGAGTAPCGRW